KHASYVRALSTAGLARRPPYDALRSPGGVVKMRSKPVHTNSHRLRLSGRLQAVRWLVALLVLSCFTTACTGATPSPTAPVAAPAASTKAAPGAPASAAGAPLKVRILVTITDRCCLNYIPMLIGARLGMFEKNGLDVDWIPQ